MGDHQIIVYAIWGVAILLCLIFYKFILRVFFGVVIIAEDKIGLVTIGKSSAEGYKLAVEAMGGNNFTQLKITESIGANKIKVIPDVLITGGNDSPNGPISGLLGLELMKELAKKVGKEE